MELKQNPFSLYDFLGYFTPGGLAIYVAIATIAHLDPSRTFAQYLQQYLGFDRVEVYIPFVLLAYSIGHILNLLSSFTVERYAVLAIGYPSKHLLGFPPEGYFSGLTPRSLEGGCRVVLWIIMVPIAIWDLVVGKLFNLRRLYAKRLDKLLLTIIKQKLMLLITRHANIAKPTELGDAEEHDFFRYAYHFALENAPAHSTKMQNYVALYGFLRALTLIAVLIFWTAVLHLGFRQVPLMESLIAVAVTSMLSFICFLGFLKFYARFSLEAFMAMAVTVDKTK